MRDDIHAIETALILGLRPLRPGLAALALALVGTSLATVRAMRPRQAEFREALRDVLAAGPALPITQDPGLLERLLATKLDDLESLIRVRRRPLLALLPAAMLRDPPVERRPLPELEAERDRLLAIRSALASSAPAPELPPAAPSDSR